MSHVTCPRHVKPCFFPCRQASHVSRLSRQRRHGLALFRGRSADTAKPPCVEGAALLVAAKSHRDRSLQGARAVMHTTIINSRTHAFEWWCKPLFGPQGNPTKHFRPLDRSRLDVFFSSFRNLVVRRSQPRWRDPDDHASFVNTDSTVLHAAAATRLAIGIP